MIWHNQPMVKKGDIIIYTGNINGGGGYEQWQNKPLRVASVGTGSNTHITVLALDGIPNSSPLNLYSNQMEWIPADKEKIIELCKKKLTELTEEIRTWEMRIDFYENYESEDEYIAEKMDELLSQDTKKGKVRAIGELRKFLSGGGIFWNLK